MKPIRHIRRIAAVLTGLVAAVVAFAAAPAFATEVPPAGGGGPALAPQHLAPVHAIVASGMPGWLVTLIAACAALLAATFAVLIDHRGQGTSVWTARGAQTVPPAGAAGPVTPLPADTAGHPAQLVTGARRG